VDSLFLQTAMMMGFDSIVFIFFCIVAILLSLLFISKHHANKNTLPTVDTDTLILILILFFIVWLFTTRTKKWTLLLLFFIIILIDIIVLFDVVFVRVSCTILPRRTNFLVIRAIRKRSNDNDKP
jgi:amino acid transporter